MAAENDHTDPFRGASFTGADFTNAKFRDCDLRHVKIADSWLTDINVSGFIGKARSTGVRKKLGELL